MARKPTAIIDVGSNSIRLVVYSGDRRVPFPIFNEKVLAGLGASLAETGAIGRSAGEKALRALKRFKLLVGHIDAGRIHLLATSAVREASNGPQFAQDIRSLGLPCRVVSAEEEASLAGLGVISGIPWADGIVGDLGGGSLELAQVRDRNVSRPGSLPLGVLRAKRDGKEVRDALRTYIARAGLARGGEFYMVGGSWRALAQVDMIASDYPLPILQQYRMLPERAGELLKLVNEHNPEWEKSIASARLASLPVAALILASIAEELQPRRIVLSTYGIREGLLYSALSERRRQQDPLVSGARELSQAEGPTKAHGDRLNKWMSRGFDDPPNCSRIRHAACLIAAVAWRANPIFRSERAIQMALHGNWVGIDAGGRVLMAHALSWAFDRDDIADTKLLQLCSAEKIERARHWGLAMRVAQKLSGGVASILEVTHLRSVDGRLELRVPADEGDLVNDGVLKRLNRLAESIGRAPAVEPI